MKITSCVPLVIYLILIGLNLVSYILSGAILNRTGNILIHLVSATAVSGLLYWLCTIKYVKTAWFVLLLPFIVLLFILFSFTAGIAGANLAFGLSNNGVSAKIRSRVRARIN